MQPNRQRTWKLIMIAWVAIFVIAVIVVLLVAFAPKNSASKINQEIIDAYSSQTLARNVRCPMRQGDTQKIRFFTGTAVAELDINTLRSTRITNEFALAQHLSCDWNSDGTMLLLRISRTAGSDIQSQGNDAALNAPSWWVIDIQKNTITPVFRDVSPAPQRAAWAYKKNRVIAIANNNGNQKITEDTLGSSTGRSYAVPSDAQLVGDSAKGILVASEGKLIAYNKAPTTVSRIGNTIPILNSAGNLVIYDDGDDPSAKKDSGNATHGNMYLYNLDNGTQLKLLENKDNTNNYALSRSGFVVLKNVNESTTADTGSTTGGTHIMQNLTGGSTQPVDLSAKFKSPYAFQIGHIESAVEWGSGTTLVTNTVGDLYMIGKDKGIADRVSPYPLVFFDKTSFTNDLAAFSYDMAKNTLTIYMQTDDKQKIIQSIVDATIDTNQVAKTWILPDVDGD